MDPVDLGLKEDLLAMVIVGAVEVGLIVTGIINYK